MAKQSRHVRANHSNQPGRGASYEQHEVFDDSLLPDSVELAKLKELDPDVVNWIKLRTEKEQDARHDFNDRKLKLVEDGNKKNYNIDLFTIFCAFAIILCGMLFSYFLIKEKQVITGTVFAGGTILFAANSFLSFRKNKVVGAKKDSEN